MPQVGVNEKLNAGRRKMDYGGANSTKMTPMFQETTTGRTCQNISESNGRCGKPISNTIQTGNLCMSCRTQAESDAFLARHRKNPGMIH